MAIDMREKQIPRAFLDARVRLRTARNDKVVSGLPLQARSVPR